MAANIHGPLSTSVVWALTQCLVELKDFRSVMSYTHTATALSLM